MANTFGSVDFYFLKEAGVIFCPSALTSWVDRDRVFPVGAWRDTVPGMHTKEWPEHLRSAEDKDKNGYY